MIIDSEKTKELRAQFPHEAVGLRIIATSKDRSSGLVVAYISARDVMNRLDDVLGAENWSHTVTPIGTYVGSPRDSSSDETIFVYQCTLTVRVDSGLVEHQDIGEGTSPKAAASDSLKRAAVHFGVGRYLYETDPVWVKIENRQVPKHEWDRALKLMLGPVSANLGGLEVPEPILPPAPKPAPKPAPGSAPLKPVVSGAPSNPVVSGASKPVASETPAKPAVSETPAKPAVSETPAKPLAAGASESPVKPLKTLSKLPAPEGRQADSSVEVRPLNIPKAEARQAVSGGATPQQIAKITELLVKFVPGDDALAREIRRTTVEGHIHRPVKNILDLTFAEAESLLTYLYSFITPFAGSGE